jgi:hypothetical protein
MQTLTYIRDVLHLKLRNGHRMLHMGIELVASKTYYQLNLKVLHEMFLCILVYCFNCI